MKKMRLSLRSGAIAVGALVAVSLLAVAALGGAFAGSPHRDLSLTSRPSDQVRAKHINEANEASYDDGYEICLAAGLTSLARRLDVKPATPRAVARAFSLGYDPSFRRGPYLGCLDAFLGR